MTRRRPQPLLQQQPPLQRRPWQLPPRTRMQASTHLKTRATANTRRNKTHTPANTLRSKTRTPTNTNRSRIPTTSRPPSCPSTTQTATVCPAPTARTSRKPAPITKMRWLRATSRILRRRGRSMRNSTRKFTAATAIRMVDRLIECLPACDEMISLLAVYLHPYLFLLKKRHGVAWLRPTRQLLEAFLLILVCAMSMCLYTYPLSTIFG